MMPAENTEDQSNVTILVTCVWVSHTESAAFYLVQIMCTKRKTCGKTCGRKHDISWLTCTIFFTMHHPYKKAQDYLVIQSNSSVPQICLSASIHPAGKVR